MIIHSLSLDLFKIDIVNKNRKANKLEFKKVNNNYYLTGSQFDGSKNIKNLLDNSSKSIFSSFKNLNTYIYLDIGKYFVDSFSYLSKIKGDIQLKSYSLIKSVNWSILLSFEIIDISEIGFLLFK